MLGALEIASLRPASRLRGGWSNPPAIAPVERTNDMDTGFLSLALAASALILALVCAAALAPEPGDDPSDESDRSRHRAAGAALPRSQAAR